MDLKELRYKPDRSNQKLLIGHSDSARGHAIDALSCAPWQGIGRVEDSTRWRIPPCCWSAVFRRSEPVYVSPLFVMACNRLLSLRRRSPRLS